MSPVLEVRIIVKTCPYSHSWEILWGALKPRSCLTPKSNTYFAVSFWRMIKMGERDGWKCFSNLKEGIAPSPLLAHLGESAHDLFGGVLDWTITLLFLSGLVVFCQESQVRILYSKAAWVSSVPGKLYLCLYLYCFVCGCFQIHYTYWTVDLPRAPKVFYGDESLIKGQE